MIRGSFLRNLQQTWTSKSETVNGSNNFLSFEQNLKQRNFYAEKNPFVRQFSMESGHHEKNRGQVVPNLTKRSQLNKDCSESDYVSMATPFSDYRKYFNMDTDKDYVCMESEYQYETRSSCRFSGTEHQKSTSFPGVQVNSCGMDKSESQWARCCNLPQEQLRHLQLAYNNQFPIELRHYCSDWIEAQAWNQISENDPEHMAFASQLLDGLLGQAQTLEEQAGNDNSNPQAFLLKFKFHDIKNSMRTQYGCNPMELVRVIKRCLDLEKQLLEKQGMNENSAQQSHDINKEIMEKLENARKMTNHTEQMLKAVTNDQELFVVQYNQLHKITVQINQLQKEPDTTEKKERLVQLNANKQQIEEDLKSRARSLLNSRLELASKHQETFKMLEGVQKIVVDVELIKWKRNQQYSGNGAPFEHHLLEEIQQWCEHLADLDWRNRHQIIQEEVMKQNLPINNPDGTTDSLSELNQKFTALLSTLVTSTFIVDSQPPQVLKKESRFSARVRLLVGGKLNIFMTPPQVKASIISEIQARNLLKNDVVAKKDSCGDIVNNLGVMEYHSQKGELSIEFRNMQLRKIRRADKRGAEAVTEEKFCILFQSDFQIANGELMFQVWTLSLPVVVTVHGNQECNALATVLWDNQFNEPGRQPFVVPDSVPWPKVAELLNVKFTAMCGRALSSDNLQYLATKLFGGARHDDFSQRAVSWAMFNKDTMQHPNRNFTFWEWFYSIAKLTKEHIRGEWTDGHIIGFISKEHSQDLLSTAAPGTFLLRFSDSSLGGITIAWSAEDHNLPKDASGKCQNQIWNLAPFSFKDFTIRRLADRIKDLPQLITLYPNIPKNTAFGKYYSRIDVKEHRNTQNGYIPHGLVQNIESDKLAKRLKNTLTLKHEQMDCAGHQMMYDNPQTPSAASDMCPDSPADQPAVPLSANILNDLLENDDGEGVMLDYDFNDIANDVQQMLCQNVGNWPNPGQMPNGS